MKTLRSVGAILAGFITVVVLSTAKLAPHRPMHHAVILGLAGVVARTLGASVAWDESPHW